MMHNTLLRPTATLAAIVAAASFFGCKPNDGLVDDTNDYTDVSAWTCDDGLIEVAHDIADRFPNFRSAKDHPTIKWREAHAEVDISGFGVTLVRGTGGVVFDAIPWNGELRDPSLLFFEKVGSNKNNWRLIGFGYASEWEDDSGIGTCVRPTANCVGNDIFERSFMVHEAGHHGLSGGWDKAENNNLVGGAGTVDAAGCNLIDHDDVKNRVGWGRHGRVWTTHVYLAPDTELPTMAMFDPWSRDGGNGYDATLDAGTFYEQGDCGCSEPLPEPSPVSVSVSFPGGPFQPPLITQSVQRSWLQSLTTSSLINRENGVRFFPVVNGGGSVIGYRITEQLWITRLSNFGLRSDDVVNGVRRSNGILRTFSSATAFRDAVAEIAAQPVGSSFSLRITRPGTPTFERTFSITP